MPWLKQTGAIWEAQQQGAFLKRRLPEPMLDEDDKPNHEATAPLCECLPPEQFVALSRWAQSLPRQHRMVA